MFVVSFVKHKTALPEEYGRVIFDGNSIRYDGMTCIFRQYLKSGIVGANNKTYTPKDGLEFLKNLKVHFCDTVFHATDVMEV